MARNSVASLKGKIRLAIGALAFFVFAFGVGSWLFLFFFNENTIYTVLIRFALLAAGIVIFGWWLSNEVVAPVEKVSLLAKSLERGVLNTLPKTSGAAETDEFIQSLHRNNQQMQNLLGLMDKVSSGNLDVAVTPLQQSDRLSNSFQKLLAKVTESINAKQELERLKAAVEQTNEQIEWVKSGNFDIEIKSTFPQTQEIADTLNFLMRRLNELVLRVRTDSKQAQMSARELQKTIQTIVGADENRLRETKQATHVLEQIPQSVQKISEELFASAYTARQSIEKARGGSQKAQANVSAVNVLRQQIRESVKRIGQLNERSREIGKVAKTVEDLAQRTTMIALNASIQAAELGEQGRGFVAFTEEIERLAGRAANTHKQISTVNKSISAEIGEIERALQDSVGESANLSKFAIGTGNSLSELEKYINQFLNLQEKLGVYSGEQTADSESAFQSFAASIAESEDAIKVLKESEMTIAQINASAENLQLAVADFKVSISHAAEETPPEKPVLPDFETDFAFDKPLIFEDR